MAGKNRKNKKNKGQQAGGGNLQESPRNNIDREIGVNMGKSNDSVLAGSKRKAPFFALFKKKDGNRIKPDVGRDTSGTEHIRTPEVLGERVKRNKRQDKKASLAKNKKLSGKAPEERGYGSPDRSDNSSAVKKDDADNTSGRMDSRKTPERGRRKSLSDFLHNRVAPGGHKDDKRIQKEAGKKQKEDERRRLEREAKSIAAFLKKQTGPAGAGEDNSGNETGKLLSKKGKRTRQAKKPEDKSAGMSAFKNDIKLLINGYNQTRLINALTKDGIKIKSLKRHSQKQLSIVVPKKCAEKTFAILDKLCYNYETMYETGAKPALAWIVKRAGLIAGALIFTALAFFSGTFIWKIEITGNDRVDELQILRELRNIDIAVGKNKKFDEFSVRQTINSIDNILECTVEVIGTTVRIRVVETTEYNPPEPAGQPRDIVSKYDAEITRVIVKDGTGKVGIGDRIAAGSILISREVLNTNGEVMGETRADGEVYGKVVFSKSSVVSTSQETSVRTGRTYRMTELKLWGMKIGAKNKNKFLSYETVYTESYPFKNTFLPIKINQTTFYETETTFVETAIEELQEKFKREALLELVINAGGSEINTIVTREEIAAGLYRVHVYIEAEMKLS